jgi:hypothetical protein
MDPRVTLAIVCFIALLTGSVSAASISLADITGMPGDEFIALPELPPPTDGSILERKVLDTQPFVFKSSYRLLREAEISRDLANKHWNEEIMAYQQKLNRQGNHYTVDQVRQGFLSSPDPLYTPGMVEALQEYKYANRQYNAALAATGSKDYDSQARIFESAAVMYGGMGATKAQEQVENAALAARARSAAEELPLSPLVALAGLIGAFLLVAGKQKNR